MNLLAQRHADGRRFEPVDVIEAGDRIVVELGGGGFKVFTFADDAPDVVLLEDCVDREDALAKLR